MKYYLYTKDFWIAASHRALRTFFQGFCGLSVTGAVFFDVNWKYIVSASLTAAIISLATACATGLPEVEE